MCVCVCACVCVRAYAYVYIAMYVYLVASFPGFACVLVLRPIRKSTYSDWSEYEHTGKAWERGYVPRLLTDPGRLAALAPTHSIMVKNCREAETMPGGTRG